jgi:hypothetical protein
MPAGGPPVLSAPLCDAAEAGCDCCPKKPRCDNLEYRFITLANSLRALLVSDPSTDKAAAALDVGSHTGRDVW